MGKTVVAGLIGGYLFWFLRQDWTLGLLLAGIGCELGHMFPAFYGFKGGKGILCGGTLAWMLGWKVGLVAWGLFAALWLLSKYVSLGSIFAGISLTVSVFLFYGHNWLYTAAGVCHLRAGGLVPPGEYRPPASRHRAQVPVALRPAEGVKKKHRK